jgi:Xaa-Pro aminopeptidase
MKEGVQGARVERLREGLGRAGLKGGIIVPGPNMKYFTGVDSLLLERPFMLMVPVEGEPQLVAPTLESGPYAESHLHMEVHPWTDSEGPSAAVAQAAGRAGMKGRWGVEGRAPFGYLDRLIKLGLVDFRSAEHILQGLREVKDDAETRLLKKAAAVLGASFEELPGLLKEGSTELEVARAATELIYEKGATKVDDMLVQSGPRAADPHALPSRRKIGRGESVIIDVGATIEGYYADVTRTFCIGASARVREVYERVLEAEEAGIRAASEGVTVGKVDAAARGVLERAGLAKFFFHRTGHGLGLEIHEAPYIVEGGMERLSSGMCFTVEPGAYIKGSMGVRIEDDVLIERKKGIAITVPPKDFGWWN